jgi:AcrR family transcriptional regulator
MAGKVEMAVAASGDDSGELRGLRADARRNREKIVTAARALFMAEGPGAPLDDVARLAGIGKGTLYRNFPDRDTLLAAIAYDTFRQLADLASSIRETEDDAWIALCRYLREWSALRLGVLYDALCDQLPVMTKADPELRAARAQWLSILEQMVGAAQTAGRLRPDVRAGDIALFMNILQQRKTGHALLAQSSERFLELMLDGLSARRDVPLPGEPLTTKALDR